MVSGKMSRVMFLCCVLLFGSVIVAFAVTSPPGGLLNDPEAMTGTFSEGTTETFKYQQYSGSQLNVTSLDVAIYKDGSKLVIEPYDTAVVRTILGQGSIPMVVKHSREGVSRNWESPFDTLFGPELVYSGDT